MRLSPKKYINFLSCAECGNFHEDKTDYKWCKERCVQYLSDCENVKIWNKIKNIFREKKEKQKMEANNKKARQGLKDLLVYKLRENDYVINFKDLTIKTEHHIFSDNPYTYYIDQNKIDDFCSKNSELLPYMIRDRTGCYKVFNPSVILLTVFMSIAFSLLSFLIVLLVQPQDILYCFWSIPTSIITSIVLVYNICSVFTEDKNGQLSNLLFENFSKQVCGVDNLLKLMSLEIEVITDKRKAFRMTQEKSKLVELLDCETNNERRAELILEIIDKKINFKN